MPSRKLIYTSLIACVSRRTSCASPSETYLTKPADTRISRYNSTASWLRATSRVHPGGVFMGFAFHWPIAAGWGCRCLKTRLIKRHWITTWPQAFKKLVEDKANGPALIALLSDQVPGIVAIRPDGTKASRTHAVSSLIEAGNVVLPVSSIAPWVDAFVDECAAFPKGAHDDQVDCCTQALKALQVGWGEIETLYWFDEDDAYRVHISPF
jgi:predicted phage terminase large subunit-like protein